MKKLLIICGGVALFSFQACQQKPSNPDVNTYPETQNDQTIMDADKTSTSGQDTSTVNMKENTRMNQAADDADPNR